jgi:pimeloyl-ACP methyl ester carboxylesterase
VEGELIGLQANTVEVDVAAFERGVAQETRDALREATSLYRGELLDGFRIDEAPFDDWLAAERQRLRELGLNALERLLAMDLAAGSPERAVETGLRLLALDPLRRERPPHAHGAVRSAGAADGGTAPVPAVRRGAAARARGGAGGRHHAAVPGDPERRAANRHAPARTTTRYVRSGDVNLAYQVIGDGPPDLVLVPGWVSNVECFWEEPRVARFLRRLASIGRLILFDKRGTGLSDRVPPNSLPTLEQRMTDVGAIMDAVGSKRATLVGYSEGARCARCSRRPTPTAPRGTGHDRLLCPPDPGPDHPWGPSVDDYTRYIDLVERDWGGPIGIARRAPSAMNDEAFSRWWARFLRMSASPGRGCRPARHKSRISTFDTFSLPFACPRLCFTRWAIGPSTCAMDATWPPASRAPRYVELPSDDHLPWLADADAIGAEIERFVADPDPATEPDRVLVTVMVAERMPSRGKGTVGDFREAARSEILGFVGGCYPRAT